VHDRNPSSLREAELKTMKLHSDLSDSSLRITAYDASSVAIGERRITSTFVITPQDLLVDLPEVIVQELSWAALNELHHLELEILLVGTGSRQLFASSDFYVELSRRRIGLEVMTSPAACRTFNILAAENRRVAALITFDPS
jgi:uncharacterized protein